MSGLKAGGLNHRITIQRLTSLQDETTGNITEEWTTFAELWANVRTVSGREFVAAGGDQSKTTATIRVRHMTGILPSMRVIHGAHVYQIEDVLDDPYSGREWLTLPVSEVRDG